MRACMRFRTAKRKTSMANKHTESYEAKRGALAQLLLLMKPYWARLLVVAVFIVLANMADLVKPRIYQTIIDDSFATLEANHVMRPQEKFLRFRNDPTFLQLYHARQCNTLCPPSKRKYLRLGNQPGFYNAVGGIVLALTIFALDAIITRIFGLL